MPHFHSTPNVCRGRETVMALWDAEAIFFLYIYTFEFFSPMSFSFYKFFIDILFFFGFKCIIYFWWSFIFFILSDVYFVFVLVIFWRKGGRGDWRLRRSHVRQLEFRVQFGYR